jgi:hypothetical protein
VACSALTAALWPPCTAQVRKITQSAGVDNTTMGAYRALAQLSFQAFQKRDYAMAAELAKILDRTWGQGQWHNEGSVCKTNHDACAAIDHAMDLFIGPIVDYIHETPDPAAVKTAYDDYLGKLTQADAPLP